MQYTETLDLGGARSGRPEAPKGIKRGNEVPEELSNGIYNVG